MDCRNSKHAATVPPSPTVYVKHHLCQQIEDKTKWRHLNEVNWNRTMHVYLTLFLKQFLWHVMLHRRDWPSSVYQDEPSCSHYLPISVHDDDSRASEQCATHEAYLNNKCLYIHYTSNLYSKNVCVWNLYQLSHHRQTQMKQLQQIHHNSRMKQTNYRKRYQGTFKTTLNWAHFKGTTVSYLEYSASIKFSYFRMQ